ncbi:hypothetical protein TrLO_g15071 [Triparma laevis f. longispina]|uniref:Uncharacterized protein n=1 Tax=Triparma laevis f. longispina TaxID=1714387 RepID=A0A9W7AIC6_9STRA|nr:hypothetical protein TrLO_g15071 [Triparma laevis f. longispina]
MLRLFGGDLCLVTWIQKLFGLYLTGEKYSKMVCFSGDGGNGKSVLSRWLGKLLGDFAQMNCPKALLFDHADSSSSSFKWVFGWRRKEDLRLWSPTGFPRQSCQTTGRSQTRCLRRDGQGLCFNDENFKQITGGGDTMAARRLQLDAMLDSSAEEFFAWCVQGSFFDQAPIEYTWSLEDGVSLKDLAELWAEEGFGRNISRALGKKLRMRTDACKYKVDILSGGRGQSKARGIKGWKLTRN